MTKIYTLLKKYKVIHILYWLYAGFDLWHILVLNRGENYIFNKYDLVKDIFYQIVSVYVIIYFLLPKLFFRQKYFLFIISSILTCFITSLLNNYTAEFYIRLINPNFKFGSRLIEILAHFVENLSVSVLFTIVILIEYYIRKEQQNKLLEKEKLEAELNFLKAQMNPHFLFNALNSIYFLMDENVSLSRDILLKFSALLRYQLYDCAIESTPLKDELDFLNNYIELEKIRNNENVSIIFNVPKTLELQTIAPLLLIPFVENAFKYVSHNPKTKNFIKIDCTLDTDNWLDFRVENTFAQQTDKLTKGLGIINVRRRLELLYSNKHQLVITENKNVFFVHLKICLA